MKFQTEKSVKRLQNELAEGEALLVASIPNRFYLTGFESSAGYVFITAENAYFLIDFRYVEKARQTVSSCEVRLSSAPLKEISALCAENGIKCLFLEAEHTSVSFLKQLREEIGVEISEDDRFDRLLEEMRSVKSEKELSLIKEAQRLTDETFKYIIERITAGRTEKEIMLDMEFFMRRRGSEGVSFDFIVVSGKNSSLPHGVPTDKPVEKGDFITMDFGAVVGGYHSDMTRTVLLGHPTEEQERIYNTVLSAQTEAVNAVKAGLVCKDIDKIARDIIYSAGFEGCFGHGLGHSVGIEIHERPNFNMRCDTVLKPGTVMTVEPGIYLEGKYGVRIEDMVYVTEDGCIDITESPRNLICLD